ncbi:MAG: SGNH/GDSL hydrolase family protein [Clostridia bacterium]|nr:SGNH/GDSL hydrolase family protein [Clostridia bacterium]
MKKAQKRRLFLLAGILAAVLAVALATTLIVLRARDAAEQQRLEEERSRLDATAGITTDSTEGVHPSRLSGLQLLRAGITDFNLYYFGDEAICGQGASSFRGTEPEGAPYRLKLRSLLQETYAAPSHFVGRVATNSEAAPFSFADGALDFSGTYNPGDTMGVTGLNYRLAVIAPGAANETAGGRGFASELETLLRTLRGTAEYCNIILVVPHGESADSERAEAILALGARYATVVVDMRAVFVGHPEYLHTEGASAGLPNDAGHTAYAEAIAAAIGEAAATATPLPPLPAGRLYPF